MRCGRLRWGAAVSGTLGVCAALMLVRLGPAPMAGPHEARIAGAARAMLRTGDVLIPTFNHQPRLKKPPLPYWATAVLGRLAGSLDADTARLPSALCGLLTASAVLVVAARRWGLGWGCLVALLLTTTVTFLKDCRVPRVDIYLTAFTTVALTAWFAAYAEPFPRRPWLWQAVVWIALGLAFLSKGPAVFLTAVVPLLLWPRLATRRVRVAQAPSSAILRQPGAVASRNGNRARSHRLAWWAGPALFLAVALPWPVAVALVHPPALDVWWGEIARRSDPTVHPLRPVYYYVLRLPVALFPWIILTIGGGISVFRHGADEVVGPRREKPGTQTHDLCPRFFGRLVRAAERLRWAVDRRPLETYALLWILGAMTCWSLVGQKKVAYLLPAIPAAALLAAGAWRQWHREYSLANSRVAGLLQAGLHGLVAIAAGGAIWFRPVWWPWCVILVAVHLIGGAVLLWSAWRRRLLPGIVASVGAFVVLALVVSGVLTPYEVRRHQPLDLAHRARAALDADPSLPVYFLHFKDDPFIYALDAPTAVRFVIFDLQPGHDRWRPLRDVAESGILLVARAADWGTAPPDLAAGFREIARQEHFGAKGFEGVWVDKPGTPTLLLTNRPENGVRDLSRPQP